MEYQKRCKAGQIKIEDIKQAQYALKCLIATLQNVSVINPFATLIELPEDIAHPRKSLLLLLNFIEVITYFFQYQREQIIDRATGEYFIKTHPEDIKLAFSLLKNSLFRRADELSTTARGFYKWLTVFLTEAKTKQFTALDIRKAKAIHPRTLNRYLQELKLYGYIKVIGGNKNREGYRYQTTGFGNQTDIQKRIEKALQTNLDRVNEAYGRTVRQQDKPRNPLRKAIINSRLQVRRHAHIKSKPNEKIYQLFA
jgi:DNA-binding HxlR family transcriptional regulator